MEIWKEIEGYENYQVSNYGNVKSLCTGNLLKQSKSNCGYLRVHLFKKGKGKHLSVHRLVATAFIPKENGKECVNHKDENKENNNVENLEWCNHKYNDNFGARNERISKMIVCKETGETFKSIRNASMLKNINENDISQAIRGLRKKAGGFSWELYGL